MPRDGCMMKRQCHTTMYQFRKAKKPAAKRTPNPIKATSKSCLEATWILGQNLRTQTIMQLNVLQVLVTDHTQNKFSRASFHARGCTVCGDMHMLSWLSALFAVVMIFLYVIYREYVFMLVSSVYLITGLIGNVFISWSSSVIDATIPGATLAPSALSIFERLKARFQILGYHGRCCRLAKW